MERMVVGKKKAKKGTRHGGRPNQGRRQWMLWLNDEDHANIELVQDEIGAANKADAVRQTLHREAQRIKRRRGSME